MQFLHVRQRRKREQPTVTVWINSAEPSPRVLTSSAGGSPTIRQQAKLTRQLLRPKESEKQGDKARFVFGPKIDTVEVWGF
jgi:hypothetical protein